VLSGVVLVTVPGRAVADEVAGLDADEVRAVGVAVDLPSELCAVDPCGERLNRDRFKDVLAKFSKASLHKSVRIGGRRLPGRQSRGPPDRADPDFVELPVGLPEEEPDPRRCIAEQFLGQEEPSPVLGRACVRDVVVIRADREPSGRVFHGVPPDTTMSLSSIRVSMR
jgi:hypothetical protein